MVTMTENNIMNTMNESVEKLAVVLSSMQHCDGTSMPSADTLREFLELVRSVLFPGYYGRPNVNSATLKYHIGVSVERIHTLLAEQIAAAMKLDGGCGCSGGLAEDLEVRAYGIAAEFVAQLPEIRRVLATDVVAAYNGDPAAKNYAEVICCYPIIKELTIYRTAHALWTLGVPLIPRMLTEMGHSETGIDIHPGATIGEYFTIDHGTGVVIGETSIIGNNVKLYQGVTLGAKSFPLDDEGNPIKGIARHPILEDNVIVYSNASILGRITIGKGATVGGNVWVTNDVPAGAFISQTPRRLNG